MAHLRLSHGGGTEDATWWVGVPRSNIITKFNGLILIVFYEETEMRQLIIGLEIYLSEGCETRPEADKP